MDDKLLYGLQETSSNSERQVSLRYFEDLKSSDDGWKLSARDFTEKIHRDDHVKFFCLQVLEHHARTRHLYSSDDDILALRKVLLTWIQDQQQVLHSEKTFVKNKMAQIFALTFVTDYPLKWPQFFSDLLQCVQSGDVCSVDLYLRILKGIDCEVFDRLIIHSQEENVRNTMIKDHMRDHCVAELVDSWIQIMNAYDDSDHSIVCLAMDVVGAYVAWVNISLIANDRCISLLLKYLSVSTLRESAVDCLHEIIAKGMDPVAKIKLVESLCKILESIGVLDPVHGQDGDPDFIGKLSKLVNGMGCSLITSWNKLVKAEDDANANEALQAIERKLPYLHRFLCDEDDGVSEAIISFAVQYIGILKQQSNLSDNDRTQLQSLLGALISKLKYDDDYNFNNEGEEEAMFIEYRKQLKVLFDNISQLDPHLVLQTCESLLSNVLSSLNTEPFMNVEVVLRVFYMIGEAITDKQFGAVNIASSSWHKMMIVMLQSPVSCHSHTAVLIQYYETLVRYDKFFQLETEYIPSVMEGFLGSQGIRHTSSAVRSRLSYLFVRFVKSIKNHVASFANQVLSNLEEILLMLPGTPNYNQFLSVNDMMFMYETAGILVVFCQQSPEGKGSMMNAILSPLVDKFQFYLSQLSECDDPTQQEAIAQVLNQLISFASRTSKVFTNHLQVRQNGCLQCFAEPLPVFLRGLEMNVQQDVLQSGVRQYLHRMIICLGDELLNYVPIAVSLLLKDCKSRELQEFIPLINQLITKYKQQISPILRQIFMPVCQNILSCVNLPCDPNEFNEVRDRQNLKKCYFMFISSITINSVTDVIASQDAQNLQEVLGTVVHGAVNFPDPSVQKVCYGVLKKFVESWGAGEVLPGFVAYMYEHILPACFLGPLKVNFDLNDGHSFLALGEIAGTLKAMITCRGNEMVAFLQTKYLPSINLPQETTQVFLKTLQESETKILKSYLKGLFTTLRTHSLQS